LAAKFKIQGVIIQPKGNAMAIAICSCGNVQIELSGTPITYGICHCESCRRRTGSAFGVSVYVSRGNVLRIDGDFIEYRIDNQQSSGSQVRYFCASCGTTVYWEFSDYPDEIGIAGGCFDSEYISVPQYSVSNDKKATWFSLSDEITIKEN
jgi:hypothetical protein